MTKPARLDLELVRRGLAGSRGEARRAIEEGKVLIRGVPSSKPSSLVSPDTPIALAGPPARFASRAGEKLDGALDQLAVDVAGRLWLDVGASTGGFTDCLLRRGAAAVVALDVGYGQLDWKLRGDERVVVMERVNARHLAPEDLPWRPDAVAADVSFISLTALIPPLVAVAAERADFVLMVKPQFEVGPERVGKGGVVRSPELWREAVERVAEAAKEQGLRVLDVAVSLLPGPAGNREFFLHLRRSGVEAAGAIERAIEAATQP